MIIRGMGVGGWNLHELFCMQAPQTVCMMIQAEKAGYKWDVVN